MHLTKCQASEPGSLGASSPRQPGQSGNPAGRPKGSRNKLSEAFLQALADDFEANGKEVVEKVRTERPHDYLKIIVAVLPKRMEIEDATPEKHPSEMTDDELEAIIWRTERRLEEMGIEKPLTEDDLTQARARRIARGERPRAGADIAQ
jgi:hypothetical protein